MNKKKTILLGIVFLTIVMISGASFALWQMTLKQSTTNVITTGCFKIQFEDENPISLNNAFPITDEEGSKLVPYTFTITNTCESYASYQINLEILNDTTLENFDYLKIMFEDSIDVLSKKETVSKTLENATTSKKLETGYLDINESKTYHLKLWMSEDTPNDASFMNQVFQSKVTVIATYQKEFDRENPISAIEVTNLSDKIKVDASNSSDNTNIKYYYYSLDGENFVKIKEPEYTFEVGALEYGVATDTIKTLADSLNDEYMVYVKTEDEYGNMSEVVSSKIYKDFAYDNTADNNLRYIGSSPNNYVSFNDELWRVIGVMNNIDDGTGNKETRIKLIRDESIGAYSWDTSSYEINYGWGVNEWSQSKLRELLNVSYYNSMSNLNCFNNRGNAAISCSFLNIGLKELSKSFIDTVLWNTGSNGGVDHLQITTEEFYRYERSDNLGKLCTVSYTCDDNVTRTTTWIGEIGLIYPSDYGYATSGEAKMNRKKCLDTSLNNWRNADMESCFVNNWLNNSGNFFWTITPYADAEFSYIPFSISKGPVANGAFNPYDVYPSFYLKDDIKIVNGHGTKEEPYLLSKNDNI